MNQNNGPFKLVAQSPARCLVGTGEAFPLTLPIHLQYIGSWLDLKPEIKSCAVLNVLIDLTKQTQKMQYKWRHRLKSNVAKPLGRKCAVPIQMPESPIKCLTCSKLAIPYPFFPKFGRGCGSIILISKSVSEIHSWEIIPLRGSLKLPSYTHLPGNKPS